jgi:hypothetical protein
MKAVILYRPQSEFARRTEEYAHDFERTRGVKLEQIDVDSTEGSQMAELYGIMQYPALIIIKDDGQILNDWQGIDQFPLMADLAVNLAA